MHLIPVPMICPELLFIVPGEDKRKLRYSDTSDYALKALGSSYFKNHQFSPFPKGISELVLDDNWLLASLTIELKSLGQPLLHGCDLLHGIVIKIHSTEQVIQPEVVDFHTVLSFTQQRLYSGISWVLLQILCPKPLLHCLCPREDPTAASDSLLCSFSFSLRWQLNKKDTLQIL